MLILHKFFSSTPYLLKIYGTVKFFTTVCFRSYYIFTRCITLTAWLVKRFVKRSEHTDEPAVRAAYGQLAGITGIAANILLFAAKFFAGLLSGSIAVMADAFNNFSDAGSSVVTLIGLKVAAKPADPDHPFGHGRSEYLASLIIAAIIFVVGGSFFKTSLEKIFTPEDVSVSTVVFAVLLLSIAVKLWLYRFNNALGSKIGSSAIRAAGQDSLNDVWATLAVMVSSVLSLYIDIPVDGVAGVSAVVAVHTGLVVVCSCGGLGQPGGYHQCAQQDCNDFGEHAIAFHIVLSLHFFGFSRDGNPQLTL